MVMGNHWTIIFYHIIIRLILNIFLKHYIYITKKKPYLVAKTLATNLVCTRLPKEIASMNALWTIIWSQENKPQLNCAYAMGCGHPYFNTLELLQCCINQLIYLYSCNIAMWQSMIWWCMQNSTHMELLWQKKIMDIILELAWHWCCGGHGGVWVYCMRSTHCHIVSKVNGCMGIAKSWWGFLVLSCVMWVRSGPMRDVTYIALGLTGLDVFSRFIWLTICPIMPHCSCFSWQVLFSFIHICQGYWNWGNYMLFPVPVK